MIVITQSCLTLYNPGSSAHGIFQARILEWVAFPSPGDPEIKPESLMSPALAVPPGNSKQASLSMSTHTPLDLRTSGS